MSSSWRMNGRAGKEDEIDIITGLPRTKRASAPPPAPEPTATTSTADMMDDDVAIVKLSAIPKRGGVSARGSTRGGAAGRGSKPPARGKTVTTDRQPTTRTVGGGAGAGARMSMGPSTGGGAGAGAGSSMRGSRMSAPPKSSGVRTGTMGSTSRGLTTVSTTRTAGRTGGDTTRSVDSLGGSQRPSARLERHVVKKDPFIEKKFKTQFAQVYSNGEFPCRLQHGSVRHTIQWSTPPTDLDYTSVLVTCAEGLAETSHPYVFVARTAFKELLEAEGSNEKTVPLLTSLAPRMRMALSSSDPDVFVAATEALRQLSACVGPELNGNLASILAPLNKRASMAAYRDAVSSVLATLEENGGADATRIIKSKVPTFVSVTG